MAIYKFFSPFLPKNLLVHFFSLRSLGIFVAVPELIRGRADFFVHSFGCCCPSGHILVYPCQLFFGGQRHPAYMVVHGIFRRVCFAFGHFLQLDTRMVPAVDTTVVATVDTPTGYSSVVLGYGYPVLSMVGPPIYEDCPSDGMILVDMVVDWGILVQILCPLVSAAPNDPYPAAVLTMA